MAKAKLIIRGEREVAIERSITSLGRTPDNAVSLADDPNISRYHAEIEKRGDEYWLIELGSSNGTTVNGVRLYSEKLLRDGDLIVLGGSSQIVFKQEKDASQEATEESVEDFSSSAPAAQVPDAEMPQVAAPSVNVPPPDAAADLQKVSKTPMLLLIAGAVCVLAVVFVVAAVLVSMDWSKKCEAKAKIISPENGETISKEVEIEVEAENTDCVKRAVFLLDGEEVASVEEYPYTASLDPKKFPDFSDGLTHSLKIVFEDVEGKAIEQPGGEVSLVFETLATPTPTPEVKETPEVKPTKTPPSKQLNSNETLEMAKLLLRDVSANTNYKFDTQFLQEVQRKTSEYVSEGFSGRAASYRDQINVAFQETGVGAPIGYISAMHRSQFKLQSQGNEQGLWRMSSELVAAKGYNGLCGGEALTDPKQNCAARAAALYWKDLVFGIFEGDVIYAISAFGMSPQDAGVWKGTLPADRSDFWKVIRTPKQREEIVRFFAAGIVAKNPGKFGLKKDQAISELYKNFVNK